MSADYHDSAAALVVDGDLVAAVEEERFSRIKHDPSLPHRSIEYCLTAGDVPAGELAAVVFYDKPFTTYERLLITHAKAGPGGFPALSRAVATWSRSKLWIGARLETALAELGHPHARVQYSEHHLSHAASAFYPSPFESAAVLTFDGVGEWATSSIAHGSGRDLQLRAELRFPDSIGLFYSAMTGYCGFDINDGEYKLMGLAPYGEPRFVDVLRDRVIDIAEDGSVQLDMKWFGFRSGTRMTRRSMAGLLEGPPMQRGAVPGQREADIARSTQVIVEEATLRMAHHAHTITGESNACLAGGVALNCVANHRLLEEGPYEQIWIQPAAGDAGGSIGAALWYWHVLMERERSPHRPDGMHGSFLGPAYDGSEIATWLESAGVEHEVLDDQQLFTSVAQELALGASVGWFRGRAEFGPRALGHRSILADPRDPTVVKRLNLAVKGREGFRPFAPSVLAEHASAYFQFEGSSPYMLFAVPVHESVLVAQGADAAGSTTSFEARLAQVRSEIPACTHVDGSARVHTVERNSNPDFHRLMEEFHATTGCPVLVNTSFNRAGEPIVLTPSDALRCFEAADLDVLVLENCVVRRSDR